METILCTANNPNLPYSSYTLKYFLRILQIYLDTFRAYSTMRGDFKGTVFQKNLKGGYMIALYGQLKK
jgi:hypothetical protein